MTDEVTLMIGYGELGSPARALLYSVGPAFPTPYCCGQKAVRSAHYVNLDRGQPCRADLYLHS
jgi:hypothetical protein